VIDLYGAISRRVGWCSTRSKPEGQTELPVVGRLKHHLKLKAIVRSVVGDYSVIICMLMVAAPIRPRPLSGRQPTACEIADVT